MLTLEFILYQFLRLVSILIAGYLSGLLVVYRNVRVNYTRKIFHFALFFFPLFLAPGFQIDAGPVTMVVATGVTLFLGLGALTRPVRERIPVIATMYRAIDRPEDRPYTLFWLSTQVIVGYIVIIPFLLIFEQMGLAHLMLIPIIINGVGDGLAEPVGVRFGRHSYTVRAFHGNRRYRRTLEGSACVLVTGVVVILLFRENFTEEQFLAALITVPVLMTLAEAFSPHTWDSPFLFFVGGLSLLGIVHLL